jgi:hypothetical protein
MSRANLLEYTQTVERKPRVASQVTTARLGYTNLVRLLGESDLTPQAVFNVSVDEIASRAATFVVKGANNFDSFRGVGLKFGNVPFAFMHYRGHPEDTATLYLPGEFKNVRTITTFTTVVSAALKLDRNAVVWERKDDPDL